jgi:hypothetical protein
MRNKTLLYIGLMLFLVRCSTSGRLITDSPRLPEGAGERYQMAVDRNNSFSALTVRNINIKLETPDLTNRLNGAIKMKKDSAILISLRAPLGIELSRILYTRDSVKMVDRQNKTVHISDYQNLSGLLPLELDYPTLQVIFSGNIPDHYQTLDFTEPGTYKEKTSREAYLGTYAAPVSSRQRNFYGWIFSDIIRPSFLVFYKENSVEQLKIHYGEYEQVGSQYFPEKVEISYDNQHHNSMLSLKMSQFELSSSVDLDLAVPSSYNIIRH